MLRFIPIAVLFVCGCAVQQPLASINDVLINKPNDTGYTVVAVDGKAVDRKKPGTKQTTSPLVQVLPGTHEFTLQKKDDPQQELKLQATVASAKEYRLSQAADGSLTLIESGRSGIDYVKRQ